MDCTKMHYKLSGMLEIGVGEKCPFCDLILTKDIDTWSHMESEHQDELLANLFPEKDNSHSEGSGTPEGEMIKNK